MGEIRAKKRRSDRKTERAEKQKKPKAHMSNTNTVGDGRPYLADECEKRRVRKKTGKGKGGKQAPRVYIKCGYFIVTRCIND